jgi:thiol peroxidase
MAHITFQGKPIETVADLPEVGERAPFFALTKTDLSVVTRDDLEGKKIVLNIFPSIDTPVCAATVRRFNQEAASRDDVVVLCVSMDLPFAHARFCGAEGLDAVISASAFRSTSFGFDYGVAIATEPLTGLFARAVVIIDAKGIIAYAQQVPEIAEEPKYDEVLAAL